MYGCAGDERHASKEFSDWSTNSICFYAISLFTVVVQLISISALPSEFAADADERMSKFGSFQKFLTIVAVVTLIFGLFTITLALQWMVRLQQKISIVPYCPLRTLVMSPSCSADVLNIDGS